MYKNYNNYSQLQFSGHDTFPLRYGWLKKVYNEVSNNSNDDNKRIFTNDNAVSVFGVGKNMVSAMRYWAGACGFLKDRPGTKLKNTVLAKSILDDKVGFDPYLENLTSLWLIHWNLANAPLPISPLDTIPKKTSTIYWLFNHWNAQLFDKQSLVQDIQELCSHAEEKKLYNVAENTLKRDVDCLLRNYTVKKIKKSQSVEETLESPLVELNLINQIDNNNYKINQSNKISLSDEVFIYAMLDFWENNNSHAPTLSLEQIMNDAGSPGRVFALGNDDIVSRLENISDITDNKLIWGENGSILAVSTNGISVNEFDTLNQEILKKAYNND